MILHFCTVIEMLTVPCTYTLREAFIFLPDLEECADLMVEPSLAQRQSVVGFLETSLLTASPFQKPNPEPESPSPEL